MVYGTEVAQLGEDVVEQIADQHGAAGLIHLIADIAIRLPIEYLSEMRADMSYAARALIKSPGFALIGILSLGIGMGVTITVVNRIWMGVYRDLPTVARPSELVASQDPISYYYIDQFREPSSLFSGVAAVRTAVPFNVGFAGNDNAKPERFFGQLVSPGYFQVLGIHAQRGRVLTDAIDKPGAAPAVVISDRFWRNRLNSSPDAVGHTLRLNGQPAIIVGIAPQDFLGVLPVTPADLFIPTTVPSTLAPELANDLLHNRYAKAFLAVMRLAPGVTIDSAEAGLDTIVRHLDEQDPMNPKRNDPTHRVTLVEGGKSLPVPRNLKPVLAGFIAMLIGLILAIACMNLANMLLARGATRRKELAIRLAIGASRFRLIRQLISEGILLSLLSGIAGFAMGYSFSVMSSHFHPPSSVPVDLDFAMDWRAALFTFAIAIACGIGFSLVPALQATKTDVAPTLKEGAVVQLRGYRRFGMRNLLVVAQVAGSLMLLLMTGFLVMGFSKSSNIQTRFDPNRMYLLSIDPVRDGYSPEKAQTLFEKLPGRLRAIDGVSRIALAAQPPFSTVAGSAKVTAGNNSSVSSSVVRTVAKESVGAGYFAAMSEPVLAGREFDERDQRILPDEPGRVPLPVVLNESAARALFGSGSAVGQRVSEDMQTYQVVGVVHDLTSAVLVDDDQDASLMYLPLTRHDFASPPPGGMTIMVRSDEGADALEGIRREIAAIDPNLAVFDVHTLSEHLDRTRASLRLSLELYTGIGVFGLILASIGLAGVTAYAVARRRKEIGIRMALGARKSQVLRLVMREGSTLVAIGTILGFLGAVVMVRALSAITSMFARAFNVTTGDPRLIVGAPLLLASLAMIASYLPARKSIKIDPLQALREE
jgi:predicted permease